MVGAKFGQSLATLSGRQTLSQTGFQSGFKIGAYVRALATENWSGASNHGTKLEFYTTPTASGTNTLALTPGQIPLVPLVLRHFAPEEIR